MKVLLTLNDVEPAVRLNAALEAEGVETAVVSPLDDIRSALKRERPDVIVFSGDLTEPSNVTLVKEQLWEGTAAVGLTDKADPAQGVSSETRKSYVFGLQLVVGRGDGGAIRAGPPAVPPRSLP